MDKELEQLIELLRRDIDKLRMDYAFMISKLTGIEKYIQKKQTKIKWYKKIWQKK